MVIQSSWLTVFFLSFKRNNYLQWLPKVRFWNGKKGQALWCVLLWWFFFPVLFIRRHALSSVPNTNLLLVVIEGTGCGPCSQSVQGMAIPGEPTENILSHLATPQQQIILAVVIKILNQIYHHLNFSLFTSYHWDTPQMIVQKLLSGQCSSKYVWGGYSVSFIQVAF